MGRWRAETENMCEGKRIKNGNLVGLVPVWFRFGFGLFLERFWFGSGLVFGFGLVCWFGFG